VLTAAVGSITDGSGAEDYANNANCSWLVAPPGAKQITIVFFELGLEATNDMITLHQCTDLSCRTKQLLGQLNGNAYSAPNFVTTTGFLMIEFTSNEVGTGSGFSASWSSSISAVGIYVRAFWNVAFVD
jgi:hypothetical protein